MRIRDVIIAICVTLLMIVGGKMLLEKYNRNEKYKDDIPVSTQITKYIAEDIPYVDVEKESVKEEYTAKIRDIEYKGKLDDVFFLNSIDEICANYVCDDGTSFDVDLSKDKVVAVYFNIEKDENKKILSEDEKEKIATEYAKEFVNIEEYKMNIDNGTSCYIFTRYVDEFMTCEEVRVFVKDTGEISAVWIMELGEFENVNLGGADGEKSEEALSDKIKEMYGEKSEYEINENFLIKTRDGKLAMFYSIDLTKEDGICEREFFKVIWE